jgi:hypothetical protein
MFPQHFIRRAVPVGACGAAIFLCTTTGFAKSKNKGPNACMTVYKAAQERDRSGKLQEAKDLFATCAAASCGVLAQECASEVVRLDGETPTVVPFVTDDAGAPVVDVQVKMDGVELTTHLDGRGLPVNPGVHEFTFSRDGAVFATEKVMIAQAQRNRPISVSQHAPQKSAPKKVAAGVAPPQEAHKKEADRQEADKQEADKKEPDKKEEQESSPSAASGQKTATEADASGGLFGSKQSLVLPLVVGGAGVAALATGGLLTLWGRRDNDALSQCTPNCSPSSLDHIRTLYVLADVSFGVGVVGLGAAAWLYLRSRPTEEKPAQTGYTFDVHPTPSGAFASVKGAF